MTWCGWMGESDDPKQRTCDRSCAVTIAGCVVQLGGAGT